jgi:hypothetical protein
MPDQSKVFGLFIVSITIYYRCRRRIFMPAGPGTYGSQIGRPKKQQSGKKARKALAVQAASDSDLEEGKEKQERIKADKAKTRVGATASNDPRDPRYSPSMTSRHNSPENRSLRRARLSTGRREDLTNRMYYRAKPSRQSKKTFLTSVKQSTNRARKQLQADSIVNTYSTLATLFVETRSADNRRRSTDRKVDAERKKRERTGKSMRAYGHGKRGSKELATAKTYRSAATELESHSKKNPGPNPSRRKDVTATATHALRSSASRRETAGATQIKAGKQAAGNKRAVNRTLKRDETNKNLGKLSIR